MTKLEQLIEELCPNGVERKSIGDICDICRGRVMSKDYISENKGEYPVYSSQTENNGELGRIATFDFDGEYLSWTTDGANAGTVFYRNGKFSVTNVCGLLKIKNDGLLTKYLYYTLNAEAPNHVNSGMGNPKLMSNVMAKITIPIPPMPVQEEIVRILDTFTELTAELTAELTSELIERKQQYECYKQRLFSSVKEEAVELGSIADFSQGLQVDVNKQYQEIKSNCIRFLRIVDFVSDNEPPRYIEKPDDRYIKNDGELIMIRYGASAAGKVFIKHSGAIANNMFKINVITKNVNTKYLMYYLSQKRIYELLNKTGGKSTMPAVNFGMVSKIKIPIPSIEEQERIVAILERFDSLYNDISEGLTAEIEGRRKQYEYYRDKLLTFKEKAN